MAICSLGLAQIDARKVAREGVSLEICRNNSYRAPKRKSAH